MRGQVTQGIILGRTDFGEADRIITLLTPDHGKLRLMARGVRKVKSKLAGGIELFSVSDITFIAGRGEIGTLISARLSKHYGDIPKHMDRLQLGYEHIKLLNRVTEDHTEAEYFELLQQGFEALNDPDIDLSLINVWFLAQILRIGGHSPNLQTDTSGDKLSGEEAYSFNYEAMTFSATKLGKFNTPEIKVLRLLFADHAPAKLQLVQGITSITPALIPLLKSMLDQI
jgi:DNA repair protein RecO